jgi:hypothetical protein
VSPAAPERSPSLRREAAAWAIAIAVASGIIAALGYRARDPDSVLYARIAGDLAKRPVAEWLAPAWPPGAYMQGHFCEHPAGLFVPAALLARAGYPAEQAAYAMNAVYQALALALIPRLALSLAPALEARALAFFLQLLPIAFTYRIRANHEALVLLAIVVALLGVERSRADARWGVLTIAGLAGLLLVKGMLAAPALAACSAWAWLRPAPERAWRPWLGLGLAALALPMLVLGYELAFRAATGESFLAHYQAGWVRQELVRGPFERLTSFSYVLVWYAARVLWFAFPWSLVALMAMPLALRGLGARRAPAFALLATLLYLVPLACSERKADRYIFPVYFIVAAAGVLAGLGRWPRLSTFAERLDRRQPYATVALFLLLFALHIAGGWLNLPYVKIWGPES